MRSLHYAVLMTSCVTVHAAAETYTAVEPLLAAHIVARGGQARLDALQTISVKGTRKMGPVDSAFTRVWKRPDKIRLDFSFQGITGTQAHDGTTAWMVMPFMGKPDPEVMPPAMRESLRDQFDALGPLVNPKKKGHRIELLGRQTIDDADVYALKVTRREGLEAMYYLAADSLLLVRTVSKHDNQGIAMELTVTYGDYKQVDGLMWPHLLAVRGGAQGGDIIVERVTFNEDIPDARFVMPKQAGDVPANEVEQE